MHYIEVNAGMLNTPTIVVRGVAVQPPVFAKGTITVVKNLSGVFMVEDIDG